MQYVLKEYEDLEIVIHLATWEKSAKSILVGKKIQNTCFIEKYHILSKSLS